MNRTITVAAFITAAIVAGPVRAADLPFSTGYASSYAAPIFTWSGVYAGANAGYSFGNVTEYSVVGGSLEGQAELDAGLRPRAARTSSDGFTGGLQVGYNYQFGGGLLPSFGAAGTPSVVVGAEADAAYVDARSGATYVDGGTGTETDFQSRTEFVGTVRGRLGVAIDSLLFYATGGFAYGGVRDRAYFPGVAGVGDAAGKTSSIRTGYAYGGGIEYMLPRMSLLSFVGNGAVTVKAEFLHYDLGSTRFGAFDQTGATAFGVKARNDGNLARAGLNYKFNGLGFGSLF